MFLFFLSEAYDSPKKKAPDLYNEISDDTCNFIPPTTTSQTELCDSFTKIKISHHPTSNEITNHSVHTLVEQIPNCVALTSYSSEECSASNKNVKFVENCTDIKSKKDAPLDLTNVDSYSQVKDIPSSKENDNLVNMHIEINEPTTPCNFIDTKDNSTLFVEKQNNSAFHAQKDSTCDIPNLILNPKEQTESISFAQDNNFIPKLEEKIEDKLTDDLGKISCSENNLGTNSCETEEKPKRGISSEIKKFLEHEKDIENEFNNFESKFRSLEIPSVLLDTDLSSDTPPTSPEFGPKISKSFDDDQDDEYGSFENFNTLKSSENTGDFGEFKFSEIISQENQTTILSNKSTEAVDLLSSEAKLVPLKEDVICTEDIELEFNEQNICDSSVVFTQTTACCLSPQELLPPPLNVDEIFFEDKDDSFEPDFSQFETATIVNCETHIENIKSESVTKCNVISNDVEPDKANELIVDDDFGDFSSALNDLPSSKHESAPVTQPLEETHYIQNDDFGDFTHESLPCEDDDEDFGEFSNENFATTAPVQISKSSNSIALPYKKFDINTLNMIDLFGKPAEVSVFIMIILCLDEIYL